MGPLCMDPGLITSCNGGSIEVCIEREREREVERKYGRG